ncbi:hypothetical protein J2S00_003509 [Caldalkalibacillus uzonensis]|uniref:Uncharacterized protein n=1 Tax=Caldalkalibacillus uzonensis TaxID=353224 RepID=A0ABU0CX18_9BACI|nr:hypothetical protein [Caldalkalibacillus uzonensis]MDQ0340683.1 hypothetical protein [Caldalkalibacillus uzonensis]
MAKTKGYKGIGMKGIIAKFYAKNAQKTMDDYIQHAQVITSKLEIIS